MWVRVPPQLPLQLTGLMESKENTFASSLHYLIERLGKAHTAFCKHKVAGLATDQEFKLVTGNLHSACNALIEQLGKLELVRDYYAIDGEHTRLRAEIHDLKTALFSICDATGTRRDVESATQIPVFIEGLRKLRDDLTRGNAAMRGRLDGCEEARRRLLSSEMAVRAAGVENCATLQEEINRLRGALIDTLNTTDGAAVETVSTDFLMMVPKEVAALRKRLEAEIAGLKDQCQKLRNHISSAEVEFDIQLNAEKISNKQLQDAFTGNMRRLLETVSKYRNGATHGSAEDSALGFVMEEIKLLIPGDDEPAQSPSIFNELVPVGHVCEPCGTSMVPDDEIDEDGNPYLRCPKCDPITFDNEPLHKFLHQQTNMKMKAAVTELCRRALLGGE